MDFKGMETTHNINNAFGQGTPNSEWRFKKFKKEMRALKMSSVVAGHWKLTMTTESHHGS